MGHIQAVQLRFRLYQIGGEFPHKRQKNQEKLVWKKSVRLQKVSVYLTKHEDLGGHRFDSRSGTERMQKVSVYPIKHEDLDGHRFDFKAVPTVA